MKIQDIKPETLAEKTDHYVSFAYYKDKYTQALGLLGIRGVLPSDQEIIHVILNSNIKVDKKTVNVGTIKNPDIRQNVIILQKYPYYKSRHSYPLLITNTGSPIYSSYIDYITARRAIHNEEILGYELSEETKDTEYMADLENEIKKQLL